MTDDILNIALDGPSGSGKSTVADVLAKEFNLLHLDTGAMYRAVALKAKKLGVSVKDEKSVENYLKNLDLKVYVKDGKQVTVIDGEDVSQAIREPDVSMLASDVSKLKAVREKMSAMQREIARSMPCILDGRDIGTCVMPNAKYKFFITATAEVRAKRRYDELKAKGFDVDYDKLLEEIKQRDYNDSHREIAPLKQADDAVFVDTTNLNATEVADILSGYIKGTK